MLIKYPQMIKLRSKVSCMTRLSIKGTMLSYSQIFLTLRSQALVLMSAITLWRSCKLTSGNSKVCKAIKTNSKITKIIKSLNFKIHKSFKNLLSRSNKPTTKMVNNLHNLPLLSLKTTSRNRVKCILFNPFFFSDATN